MKIPFERRPVTDPAEAKALALASMNATRQTRSQSRRNAKPQPDMTPAARAYLEGEEGWQRLVITPYPIASPSPGRAAQRDPSYGSRVPRSRCGRLGEDRFRITAPGHEQLVDGLEEAQQVADAVAERLG